MKKKLSVVIAVSIIASWCIAFRDGYFVETNGSIVLVQRDYPDPTNHFEWMPKLLPDDYNEPEWNLIRFGNNPVPWLRFRRGRFGNYWNDWEPAPATSNNAVILQSTFEPVSVKTNGVWLITFKR